MSRLPSWLTSKKAQLREPESPELPRARLNAVQQSTRRRLSDRVEAVFLEACLSGDHQAARHLLAALEWLQTRPASPAAKNRRLDPEYLPRMRNELARLTGGELHEPAAADAHPQAPIQGHAPIQADPIEWQEPEPVRRKLRTHSMA